MSNDIFHHLTSLGITLLIALLVWRYYRHRTFAQSERYSTFGPRFWTGSVDSCVLWPLGFVTTVLLSLDIPKVLAALLVVVESLAWLIYTVVMHARYGQTVGKMVTKVRVVDFRTEGCISWQQAWLREGIPMVLSFGFVGWQLFLILTGSLNPGAVASGETLTNSKGFWLLTALPGLWFLAEVLTMLTNDKRRALHDFIAGTVVVRTNTEGSIAQLDAAPNGGPAPQLGNSGVTEGPPSVSGSSADFGAPMKARHLLAVVVSAVVVATVLCGVVMSYWQWKQPVFKEAPKLVAAVKAFAKDLATRGQPAPATVSLRELVGSGYIAARDVRAFDGMDVTLSLAVDEIHPQEILMRVRLPDGSVIASMADGSVQKLRK